MSRDGVLKAIQLRGYSGMGPYRKNTGAIGGIDIYQCPHIESVIYPVYTNKTVSGNFRGPEYPQGYYGIESMMDDVAFKLRMDPRRKRFDTLWGVASNRVASRPAICLVILARLAVSVAAGSPEKMAIPESSALKSSSAVP